MARAVPGLLVYRGDDGTEGHVELEQAVVTLGRSESCTLVMHHPTVSRLHASIVLQHDRYVVSDTNSANGTFVNWRRIQAAHQLTSDDEIWLGSRDVALRFVDPEETVPIQLSEDPPPLVIDEKSHMVEVFGTAARLSPLEYRLLRYLAHHPGTACTREACFLAVWGQAYDHATCEDALNACVTKLRRNLRAAADATGQAAPTITTLRQMGVRLETDVIFRGGGDTSFS